MSPTIQTRIEDDLNCGDNGTAYFGIIGPSKMLPGSVFQGRENAISYAEEVTGISWAALAPMGYAVRELSVAFWAVI
jgi:hypothetical protein